MRKLKFEKLGDLCTFTRGLTYKKGDEVSFSKNVVLRASNIDLTTGKIVLDDLRYISDEVHIPSSKYVKKGNILICTASGSKSHLGKNAYIEENYGYAFGGFMGQLEPSCEVEGRYFYWFLQSPYYAEWIENLSDGTNINNLKFNQISQIEVPLLPRCHQRRIVAILDDAFERIDKAIENTEKNIANAKELFDCYLNSINGNKKELGNFVLIKTGKLDANAAEEGGKYPFFTCARDIYRINSFAFDCEAILLAGNNASGDFNVKHYSGRFNAYQRTYVIVIADEGALRYRFLYYQMLNSLRSLKNSSVGTGTKFLKIGMINGLKICVPPISEQDNWIATLDSIFIGSENFCDSFNKKISKLKALKQSLLAAAFSGELTADFNPDALEL